MKTTEWRRDAQGPFPSTLRKGPSDHGNDLAPRAVWLNGDALPIASEQSRLLDWLWVPRVYVSVETMGRGERSFMAERGLRWDARRKRYRR